MANNMFDVYKEKGGLEAIYSDSDQAVKTRYKLGEVLISLSDYFSYEKDEIGDILADIREKLRAKHNNLAADYINQIIDGLFYSRDEESFEKMLKAIYRLKELYRIWAKPRCNNRGYFSSQK